MAANVCSKITLSSPIITIFGATGTGKSKLAIEIAKRFNGEVISVDSMQVYTGLDVITNKVTEAEQNGVPHHLLGFVNPVKGITVLDFRDRALSLIDEIRERKRLPVLVGGTMYYLESILFDFLIPEPLNVVEEDQFMYEYDVGSGEPFKKRPKMTDEELYETLLAVDPEMAGVLHPREGRKILRCLKLYEKSGMKMSELLKKQRSRPGGTRFSGPLRFPGAVLLWLQCDKPVLDAKLRERVDKMLENGLIRELIGFHQEYNRSRMEANEPADYTKGIFQAIGFKEYHEYLMLNEEERESEKGEKLLDRCTEDLKLSTIKYAKRQLKWIQNRFQKRGDGQIPPIYGLDVTDVSCWDEKVRRVAEEIVEDVLEGRKPRHEPLPFIDGRDHDVYTTHKCETCGMYLRGAIQFREHLEGNKHRKMLKKKNKKEQTSTQPSDND